MRQSYFCQVFFFLACYFLLPWICIASVRGVVRSEVHAGQRKRRLTPTLAPSGRPGLTDRRKRPPWPDGKRPRRPATKTHFLTCSSLDAVGLWSFDPVLYSIGFIHLGLLPASKTTTTTTTHVCALDTDPPPTDLQTATYHVQREHLHPSCCVLE